MQKEEGSGKLNGEMNMLRAQMQTIGFLLIFATAVLPLFGKFAYAQEPAGQAIVDGGSLSPRGMNTIVFQAGGSTQEGYHPTLLLAHDELVVIAKSLDSAYDMQTENQQKNSAIPDRIQVLIPDSMNEKEGNDYLEEIKRSFANTRLRHLPFVLIRVPVSQMLTEGSKILQNESANAS